MAVIVVMLSSQFFKFSVEAIVFWLKISTKAAGIKVNLFLMVVLRFELGVRILA